MQNIFAGTGDVFLEKPSRISKNGKKGVRVRNGKGQKTIKVGGIESLIFLALLHKLSFGNPTHTRGERAYGVSRT